MVAIMEAQYFVYDTDTEYRIVCNPDTDATDGRDGLVLEWRNTGDQKWEGYFFVSPAAAPLLARAILQFCKPE